MVVFVDETLEHVRPVVRPDFATGTPTMLAPAGSPEPPLGAPGTGTPFASVVDPSKRMLPLESTLLGTTCAIAASTVGGEVFCRLNDPNVRLPTVVVPRDVQVPLSINPG